MRFLIDNALSPIIAKGLIDSGYDAIHVREIGMASAADSVIINYALKNKRIVVSADTDFGTLLALNDSLKPSFILFKRSDKRPVILLELLLNSLEALREDLEKGAVAVLEDSRIRLRKLPIVDK
jgi:predicted nuclease of predicted toxin-antitoxin system